MSEIGKDGWEIFLKCRVYQTTDAVRPVIWEG